MKIQKSKKNVQTFRIGQETLEAINSLIKQDPLTFRSLSSIFSASIDHFLTLPKSEQREVIKKYLTKNL